MMSIEVSKEIMSEFLKKKKHFENLGLELIGSKPVNEDILYLVRERKK